MRKEMDSTPPNSQHGEVHRPSAPYPLTPATIDMWLRRGERLGDTLRLLAVTFPILLALIGQRQQGQQKR